jgi:hypothetical protein
MCLVPLEKLAANFANQNLTADLRGSTRIRCLGADQRGQKSKNRIRVQFARFAASY